MKLLLVICAILAFVSGSMAFQSSSGKKHRGVKGNPLQMTVLSYNGKKKNFKAGSALKSAASALGVKPKYSCRK
jgi:hypothetical protein